MGDEQKSNYIKTELVAKLLENLGDDRKDLVQTDLSTPDHLDGFMSTIHRLILVLKKPNSSENKTYTLMVKVMKGDDTFREKNLAKVMFYNEIYIYTKVLPCFNRLLESSKCSLRANDWCPKVFYGNAGKIPGYSTQYETILVMENMTLSGFRSGPRNDLDEEHLVLMARRIAQFHACTYALKLTNQPQLDTLVEGIRPLIFSEGGKKFESYTVMFQLGLERLFDYLDKHPHEYNGNDKFKQDILNLRKKYGQEPIILMQKFLKKDEYSVILHGDYNRNNVMFRYENEKPVDILMFDFQENRYATPAIDLAFFMCMSMPTGLRERFWKPLLAEYHDSLMTALTAILSCDCDDPRLDAYGYDKFMAHLNRNSLYGGMVASNFLPWMLCSEEECSQISYHFAKDVHSQEMRHLSMTIVGDNVSKRIAEIFKHLSQIGCFSIVDED